MEEGAAEVGELGAEGGERSVEISPVLGDVAMAPAMVVVMAAQLAVLELGSGWRLRRHLGGSRVRRRWRATEGGGGNRRTPAGDGGRRGAATRGGCRCRGRRARSRWRWFAQFPRAGDGEHGEVGEEQQHES